MASEVHCTDCLRFIEEGGLKEALGDRKAVLVSDPPFNIGYHYSGYKDRRKEDDYYKWLAGIIRKAGIPAVIVHYPEALYRIAMSLGQAPERVASWVYNSNTARQHRDIAFFGIKPDFSKVRQPYKNPNDKRIKERIARGIGGGRLYDWWNVDQVKNVSKKNIGHPCVMPSKVMENVIGVLPEEYVVFDPFSGSGTTGIACARLGRDFIGCEIVPEYAELSERRIEEAVKERDEAERH